MQLEHRETPVAVPCLIDPAMHVLIPYHTWVYKILSKKFSSRAWVIEATFHASTNTWTPSITGRTKDPCTLLSRTRTNPMQHRLREFASSCAWQCEIAWCNSIHEQSSPYTFISKLGSAMTCRHAAPNKESPACFKTSNMRIFHNRSRPTRSKARTIFYKARKHDSFQLIQAAETLLSTIYMSLFSFKREVCEVRA
jgi:hypothetical protein